MRPKIHPVILSGGSGTRLWPRSRKARPKPFLPLLGERTLFEETLDRVADGARYARPIVVAGAAHVPLIEEQASGGVDLIVEPAPRNTAPAIALAAHRLGKDAVMLVCPSDHHIADRDAFARGVEDAAELASEGHLVAFGIMPTRPETGYGYIRQGEARGPGYLVDAFVEKPDEARAKSYLESGDYVWNGGIFAFRAGDFLDELARHRPGMAAAVADAVASGREEGGRFHPNRTLFKAAQSDSIDYAVMERTDRAAVVAADMGWSDIGSWSSLAEARPCDEAGNTTGALGGRADLVDCRNVLVETDGPRVSAIGLTDIVIVVDGNEVLVTTRDAAQKVGKLTGASQQ